MEYTKFELVQPVLVESSELLVNILPFLLSWDKNQSTPIYMVSDKDVGTLFKVFLL